MLVKVIDVDNICKYEIHDYIKEYIEDRTKEALLGCTIQNVYEDYLEYCEENNLNNNLSAMSFKSRFSRRFGLKTVVMNINDKATRVVVERVN